MKKLIILFTLILSIASVAQNLVPNPSFENVDVDCIGNVSSEGNGLVGCAIPWFEPSDVYGATSDLNFSWFSNPFAANRVRSGEVSTRIGVLVIGNS